MKVRENEYFVIPRIKFNQFKINLDSASAVGIIGGADGPTSIFIASKTPYRIFTIIFGVISATGIIYLLIDKYLRNNL